MTNFEATELIFRYMEGKGFDPHQEHYSDSYFVFDNLGENAVCEFRVKGLRGWRFGMWANIDQKWFEKGKNAEDVALELFFTHEDNCDKFKPSRCFFCFDFTLRELEECNDFTFFNVGRALLFMKRKPIAAYVMDATDSWDYPHSNILYYLHQKRDCFWRWLEENWMDWFTLFWHRPKAFFLRFYKIVDCVEFIDGNKNGWKCHPRYDMNIHVVRFYEAEEKQSAAEAHMIWCWFHKQHYRNLDVFLVRDDVDIPYWYSKD